MKWRSNSSKGFAKFFFSLWKTALSRKDGGISQISPVNWKQEEASPSTTFAWWRIWWLLQKKLTWKISRVLFRRGEVLEGSWHVQVLRSEGITCKGIWLERSALNILLRCEWFFTQFTSFLLINLIINILLINYWSK